MPHFINHLKKIKIIDKGEKLKLNFEIELELGGIQAPKSLLHFFSYQSNIEFKFPNVSSDHS